MRQIVSVFFLLSFFVAGSAFSQEVSNEPSANENDIRVIRNQRSKVMEEIIVTAQKRNESISDVPISISAFDGDTLKQLGITNTADLTALVPGFTYAESGFGTPIYTLRGVGFTDTSFGASPTVGVYVDETNLPYSILTKGASIDIERVEVLKGPQGTSYGRNTTGGLVNYITNKPTESLEYGVAAEYGRFERYSVESYVSGPFTDRLSGRIAFRTLEVNEGWQVSITRPNDRLGQRDEQSGRASLEWQPLDNLVNLFSVSYTRDRSEPQSPQAIAIRNQNPNAGDAALHPKVANHPLVAQNTNDNRLADWPTLREPHRDPREELRWRNNETFWMGYLRSDWNFSRNMTFTFVGNYIDFSIDDGYRPQSGLSVVNVEMVQNGKIQAWSAEARVSGTWASENDWSIGAFASNDTVGQRDTVFIDTNSTVFPDQTGTGQPPLVGDTVTILGDQEADSISVFGNANWRFMPGWRLSVGLRYSEEKRDYAGCTADGPDSQGVIGLPALFNALSIAEGGSGGAEPGSCLTLDENGNNGHLIRPEALKSTNLSGRFAVDWKPTVDSLYYLSFDRGFKSGSFPVIGASKEDILQGVKQERLDAYEFGGKTSWLDRSLKVNFAIFFYDYKDKQLLTNVFDPTFGVEETLANAPKSEVKGLELDVQYSPFAQLYFTASASYIETDIKEFIGADDQGERQSFAGEEFNFTPSLSYAARVNYEWPLFGQYKLSFGADYTYTDETNSQIDGDELFAHDSYYNVNLNLRFSELNDVWGVTIWGRNITDELQTNSVFRTSDPVSRMVGMTRTYGVRFEYNYF